MQALLLTSIPLIPMLMAFICLSHHWRRLLPLPALFALMMAFYVPIGTEVTIPWLLMGVSWQLDAVGQTFLLFSAVIWLIAGIYVAWHHDQNINRPIYRCLFLLAMSGNLLLIIAADLSSFYLGFALMGLSSYGLIIKSSQLSRRASRVYLAFTLVGELALFVAMLLIFSSNGSLLFSDIHAQNFSQTAAGLLLLGFGIKLALPGLHPWLPLTYTAAPLISVAVLSGPMMKAGLLGWLRFLPGGNAGLENWGILLMVLGFIGLVFGSLWALLQKRPAAVLAYSSVAKMGLISALFGYGLAHPEHYATVTAALILFAMHHLVVKASLFLALENMRLQPGQLRWLMGAIVVAFSLIGLPFSAGLAAKLELQEVVTGDFNQILLVSGLTGILMMGHFIILIHRQWSKTRPQTAYVDAFIPVLPIWWLLLPVAWFAPFLPSAMNFDAKSLLIIIVGIFILVGLQSFLSRGTRTSGLFRPGDVFHLITRLRLTYPLHWKDLNPLLPSLISPIAKQDNKTDSVSTSMLQPGLVWLVLLGLLLTSFLYLNF